MFDCSSELFVTDQKFKANVASYDFDNKPEESGSDKEIIVVVK